MKDLSFLQGHKYDCPDCGRWWFAQDDSQELENGNVYCPYCDDYVYMDRKLVYMLWGEK